MRNHIFMSGLGFGLSMILLSPGLPAQILVPDSGTPTPDTPPATGSQAKAEDKPDVNEIIQSGTVFTNSVGMILKKAGGLWIAAEETTQAQYKEVMDSNPSVFGGEKRPVDSVSWNMARDFCARLTEHEKQEDMLPEGYRYALPTQDQWESQAKGVPLTHAVTSAERERSGTAPVGSLPPNSSGLYDLRGNVAEWCADPATGAYRVLRGGSWEDWIEVNLRLDFRLYAAPEDRKNTYGFRCVLIKGR